MIVASPSSSTLRDFHMNKALAVSVLLLSALAIGFATNNAQSGGTRSAQEVARVALTHQTGAIAQTALLNPPANGAMYRVSAYGVATIPLNNSSFWCVWFGYADDGGTQINGIGIPTSSNDQGLNNYSSSTLVLRANAGTPLTYTVAPSGTSSCGGVGDSSPVGSTYELFFVIEQL